MTKKNPAADPVRAYLAAIGRKGGQSTSDAKRAAARVNAKKKDKQPRRKGTSYKAQGW